MQWLLSENFLGCLTLQWLAKKLQTSIKSNTWAAIFSAITIGDWRTTWFMNGQIRCFFRRMQDIWIVLIIDFLQENINSTLKKLKRGNYIKNRERTRRCRNFLPFWENLEKNKEPRSIGIRSNGSQGCYPGHKRPD